MADEYGIILRITFLIHIIIGFIFGFGFLLIPDFLAPIWGLTFDNPVIRVFGAMMVGMTFASILALMTKEWARVKIIVEMELVWTILGTIVIAYHVFIPPLFNIYGWVNVGILLLLFFLFLISYYMEIKK